MNIISLEYSASSLAQILLEKNIYSIAKNMEVQFLCLLSKKIS